MIDVSNLNKPVAFWDSDNHCEHVNKPRRVDKVQIVQFMKMIIKVKKNTILVKKFTGCNQSEKVGLIKEINLKR